MTKELLITSLSHLHTDLWAFQVVNKINVILNVFG